MNLQKINEQIDLLLNECSKEDYPGWDLWELTQRFQDNWDLDSPDLKDMFHRCFSINSPLWHDSNFYPKDAMERYIELNNDLVRSMFRDLFDESRDISGRISRFMFQCDEFYKIERQSKQKVKPHFHDDKRMIFLYLSFRYPDKYCLYNFHAFQQFLIKVGSTKIASEQDIDRFIKVCRTLALLVSKNEKLVELIHQRVGNVSGEDLALMMCVFELYNSNF